MSILRQWCNKGMLLEQGKLVAFGPLEDVVSVYESRVSANKG
jgi:ABC-type polysaccharide/polyol phosphate transport system ATPase subunit